MLITAYSNNTDISMHCLTLHSPVNILNSLVYILQDIMHIHKILDIYIYVYMKVD